MQPTRKTITLPSGATCTVRRVSLFDLQSVGRLPAGIVPASSAPTREPTPDQIEFQARVMRAELTRCVGPLRYPDGTTLRIVDRPFDQCAEGEITVDELDTHDALEIVGAVTELSGMTKEAGQSARTFPEEPPADDHPAPDGQTLRLPPERPPAPDPV